MAEGGTQRADEGVRMPSWSIPKPLPEKVSSRADDAASAVERARRVLEQMFASRPRPEREADEPSS
jgi:hypothetical protein